MLYYPGLRFYLAKNINAGKLKTLNLLSFAEWEYAKGYEPNKFHATYEEYVEARKLAFNTCEVESDFVVKKIQVASETDFHNKKQIVEQRESVVRWFDLSNKN